MDSPRAISETPTQARKAYVETYGCQMNISDGELMQGVLAAQGYQLATSPEEADVILVNTCAIREHAETRVLGRVAQLNQIKRKRPELVIGVTGCMAQRMGQTLLERAPYVDLVMGPDGYRRLPEALAALESGDARVHQATGSDAATSAPATPVAAQGATATVAQNDRGRGRAGTELPVLGELPVNGGASAIGGADRGRADRSAAVSEPARQTDGRLAVLDLQAHENYEGLEVRRSSGVSAWVPIQRGCNYRCTYCIVPYVRGAEKNRDPERILDEVRSIIDSGIREVVLLGQTVNSYEHGDWRFPRLLREVARLDGIRRVRYTSPHPNDVTPELVDVMAEEPTVCKQLHLPVQAGHNRTLKRMLRRYTVESYLEKVRLVRETVPQIALSTDIIVAFPGETEEEYEATLDLVRRVRFDDAFLYKYSARDGTPATRLPADQFIAPDVAQRRLERLIALHREIQAEVNETEVGRTVEVLVEREARRPGDLLGRTDAYKAVAFPGDPSLVGRFLRVRLTGTTGSTFIGERAPEPSAARTAEPAVVA